jgi:RNA polymerase sigma factor (sigma-70 family)
MDSNRDLNGLDNWVQTHRCQWVRQAYRILRDHEEAEDVVQETLLAVLGREHNIKRLDAYIARAVDWNAVKRRARRRVHTSLEHVPAAQAENRLEPFELEQALEGLPPAQQAVIRLRFYFGLTFAEIGKNLSISIHTAASRCRYALASLRRKLRPAANQGEHHE